MRSHMLIIYITAAAALVLLPSGEAGVVSQTMVSKSGITESTAGVLKKTGVTNPSEYYSLSYVYKIYSGCLKTCMGKLDEEAKLKCQAEKQDNCKKMNSYSLKDFIMYHISMMTLGKALQMPAALLGASFAAVESAAGTAVKATGAVAGATGAILGSTMSATGSLVGNAMGATIGAGVKNPLAALGSTGNSIIPKVNLGMPMNKNS